MVRSPALANANVLEGLKKRIEPTLLGVHNGYDVFYCYGAYGYYLKYDNENYKEKLNNFIDSLDT